MLKTQAFKFSILWKSEYNVQGHKLSLENNNSRKKFGVKLLNTYWNFKDYSQKLVRFNRTNSFLNKLLKGFICFEIAGYFYFKFMKLSTKNEVINKMFNHEEKKSYFLNIILLTTFGKYIAISYPNIFNRLAFSGILLSYPLTKLELKIKVFVENKLYVDNFEMFTETNILPKLLFAASVFKFLDYFINDKVWNLFYQNALKLNRKTILLSLNIVLIAKFTQFLSNFLSDDIK